jgi:hypothetical protein
MDRAGLEQYQKGAPGFVVGDAAAVDLGNQWGFCAHLAYSRLNSR